MFFRGRESRKYRFHATQFCAAPRGASRGTQTPWAKPDGRPSSFSELYVLHLVTTNTWPLTLDYGQMQLFSRIPATSPSHLRKRIHWLYKSLVARNQVFNNTFCLVYLRTFDI